MKALSTSQKQAIIRIIEENDHDKRYVKNWRPIYLLNVNTKTLPKALSEKMHILKTDL